jgi:hypothetical protein
MKTPDPDSRRNDELDDLFVHLRGRPTAGDPARVAHGFETRVLARVRAGSAAQSDALRWFWRWSAVFGAAAVVCVVLVAHNYAAFADDALVALDGGATLLDFFY